jgi:LCP family protein required for cell wall assembly
MSSYSPRHSKTDTRSPLPVQLIKFFFMSLAVALISILSVGSLYVAQLNNNVQENVLVLDEKHETQTPPQIGAYSEGFNMLVMASDTRAGQEAVFGETDGELADVIMLVSVTPDHNNISVVSFPRDLMVDVPDCSNPETGEQFNAGFYQINSTLSRGGPSCVVNTIENVTGASIEFIAVVDFQGVIEMSTAIGGVDVCLTEPINDPYTGTYLEAGTHTLEGLSATQFLRTRHGVGDGSDLGRIGVQQVFLSSLIRKIKSDDTLTDPIKLFKLADVATKNISLSSNLANPNTVVSLAKVFEKINLNEVVFLRAPVVDGEPTYPNRVLLDTEVSNYLFELIRTDQPITVSGDNTGSSTVKTGETVDNPASSPSPTPSISPGSDSEAVADPAEPTTPPVDLTGLVGQKASDVTCTK